MVDESREEEPQESSSHKGRRRRRLLIAAGVLLLGIALLVALLPTLLSTPPGRRLVLGAANRDLPGALQVERWSLGWFSGFDLHGVSFEGSRSGHRLLARRVSVPASAFRLMGEKKQTGAVKMEGVDLRFAMDPERRFDLKPLLEAWKQGISVGPAPFDLEARVELRDGAVKVVGPDGPMLTLSDLKADVDVESLSRPIEYSLSGSVGEGGGRFQADGSMRAATNQVFSLDALELGTEASVDGLQLADLAGFMKGLPVDAEGILDGRANLALAGREGSLTGGVDLAGVRLSGGPLGEDRPRLKSADLQFDLALSRERLRLKRLRLRSPVGEASAEANVPLEVPPSLWSSTLEARAEADIAAVAEILPGLFRLQEGLRVAEGGLALNARLQPTEDGTEARAGLRLENLAAVRQGERVAASGPISLQAAGSLTGAGPRLDALSLDSPFATAQGRGTLDDFSLNVSSDLSALAREAGRFADLGEARLGGKAELSVASSAAEQAEPGGRHVEAKLDVRDLEVRGLLEGPVELDHLTADASAVALTEVALPPRRWRQVALSAESDAGSVRLDLAEARTPADPQKMELENLGLTADLALAPVARLARGAGLLQQDLELEGNARAEVRADVAEGLAHLRRADISLSELAYRRSGKSLHEPEARLSATGRADLRTRKVTLERAELDASPGKVVLTALQVPDWRRPQRGATADLSAELDLTRLMETAGEFVPLPPRTRVAGKLSVTGSLSAVERAHAAELRAVAEPLTVERRDGPRFSEPRVEVKGAARLRPDEEAADIRNLSVASGPLGLQATGALTQWSGPRRLKLEGTLTPDFTRIGKMVAAVTGRDLRLSGRTERPFSLATELGHEGWRGILQHTAAEAGVRVESASHMGVEVEGLDATVTTEEPGLRLALGGQVNGGTLDLQPVLDLSGQTPVLTLPPDAPAGLTDMEITDTMANVLVARALPVFRNPVDADGRLSLTLEDMNVPLDRALQAARAVTALQFKEVSLRSSLMLKRLLGLVKLGGATIQLPDQRMGVSLSDGRFRQNPLSMQVAGYTVVASGSVGLDRTLDMLVELPVTRELAPSDSVYEVLKNQTLKARVTGTLDQPRVNQNLVQQNLQSLLREAALEMLRQRLRD
ncbi:MAG: hypothetical protein ACOC7T_01725 [Planctomycetota bacterium]